MTQPSQRRAPGPGIVAFLGHVIRHRMNFVDYLVELAERHGDRFSLPMSVPTFVIRDPADVKHLLVSNPLNYHKTGSLTVGEKLLGQGLVSSEEPLHGKERKMMQPIFHKSSIASFGEMMARATERHIAGWKDGDRVDMASEMMHLTISIVGLSLFSIDLYHEGRELGNEFGRAMKLVTRLQLLPPLPRWMTARLYRAYDRSIANIDAAMEKIIADRKALPQEQWPNDLLSMVLSSRYEDGTAVPDKLVRDEVVTIILAGHETVANHLNWTWYLLSKHPEIHEKMAAEWEAVLGDRAPAIEDVGRLTYTAAVLAESMRLYPPAWTLARRAVAADRLPSGMEVQPRDEFLMLQYVSHRNPEWFPDPEAFRPERFEAGNKESIPKFAYYPFGMGPRFCIGEGFARLEAMVAMVLIGRRFRFEMARSGPVGKETLVTLRPRKGLPMMVRRRT
ncbi:cytochrome P450 [Luteolibacter sp. LG18]|uniref:cytochrome P450 n=1 Tax=Luteolibacter sp. LG18 TaxID=2819286 RepID=UPI002B314DE4|nr:cytochrome P450 [Luteolibacter sp. LG18]